MAGLPWVKVATDFADHPKALALAHRLSDARAPLHLPAVWGHFARHYADGSMPDTEDAHRALERASLWVGAPGALVAALVEVGFLERKRRRLAVHGWGEWQEGHARKLERDRERMRTKRAEVRGRTIPEHAQPGEVTQVESRDRRAEEERERRGDREETPSATPREVAAPAPAAPAARRARRAKGEAEPDPRHRPLQLQLEAAFLAVRGVSYGFQGGKDAKGIAELLRLSGGDAGEVERRWRRALELGGRYPGCASIALLAARWNEFAAASGGAARDVRVGAAAPGRFDAAGGDRELTMVHPDLAAILAEHDRLPPHEQRRGIRDLAIQVRDGALVLHARNRFEAARLRDTWAPGIAKLAEKALGRRVAVLVDDPERNLQVGPAPPAPREAWGGGGDVDLGTGEKRPLGVAGGQGT